MVQTKMDALSLWFADAKDFYNDIINNHNDPRSQGWFLIDDPRPVLTIVAVYLFIVWQGPKWMEHRKPYDLKRVLIVYNIFLVVLSAYMTWEFIASSILLPRSEFNLLCQPIDRSWQPDSLRLASACWLYYISKFPEILDTVFFILRKKNNQITVLHVYHHSTIIVLWWAGTKYMPGGEAWFSPVLNCSIHVLMYSYYCVAALGPQYQKYLWWKKYMTTMQLMQFLSIVVKTLYTMNSGCDFSPLWQQIVLGYAISQFLLFMNFYLVNYHSKAKKKAAATKTTTTKPRVENGTTHATNGKVDKISQQNGAAVANGNSHLHVE